MVQKVKSTLQEDGWRTFDPFTQTALSGSFIAPPPAQSLLSQILVNQAHFIASHAPTPSTPPAPTVPDVSTPIDTGIEPGGGEIPDLTWPPDFTPEPGEGGSGDIPDLEDDLPELTISAPRTTSEASVPFGPLAAAPAPVPKRPARRPPRRRRTPPPKRTRPVRPRVPSPRIPIAVPELPEVTVTASRAMPYAVLLSLVPDYLRMLGRVDQYGTEHMFDRLFPPVPEKRRDRKDDDRQRSGSPDADLVGNPLVDGGNQPGDVATIIVEGTRPRPVSLASPVHLAPFREPGYIYPPDVPGLSRPPGKRIGTKPRPRVTVNPDIGLGPSKGGRVDVLPLADPFSVPQPGAVPAPAPAPRPSPTPRPSPSPSPAPITSLSPTPFGGIGATPVSPISPSSSPQPGELRCGCRVVKPRKKPQRKERAEHEKPPELEVEYKTKIGSVKLEGSAEKYCVKAKGQRRICYTPGGGIKVSKPRAPSVGSILKKILKRRK